MLPPPHFWTSIQPLLTWGRGRPPARGARALVRARVRADFVFSRVSVLQKPDKTHTPIRELRAQIRFHCFTSGSQFRIS